MCIVTLAGIGMLCMKSKKTARIWQHCVCSRFSPLRFDLHVAGWITPGLQQIAVMSALPRWWSWKCRGWSLWLPIGLSTAPWRWREARSSRQTRQRHPSPRKCPSVHAGECVCVSFPKSHACVWSGSAAGLFKRSLRCVMNHQRKDVFQWKYFRNI